MWEKMAKRAVSLETRSYFFVFWTVFSETRPTKLAVFTCYLGIKAWNTEVVFIETRGFCCGGIHWNQGILASPKPLVSMKPPQQNPWFQWNHPRFQAFNPKTRETANFRRPSFTETVPKKKVGVFRQSNCLNWHLLLLVAGRLCGCLLLELSLFSL